MTKHQKRVNDINTLLKAVKYNHDAQDRSKIRITMKNPKKELEKYEQRAASISLPHRFGMYKTQVNNDKEAEKEDVEKAPVKLADEDKIHEKDENHKVRSIF